MTSIERVAELAATILTQPELEAWAMRTTGMTYREMRNLYLEEIQAGRIVGKPPSLSTLWTHYQEAERKLRLALEAQAA